METDFYSFLLPLMLQQHLVEYYLEDRSFHLDVLERAETQRGHGADAVVQAMGDLVQPDIAPPARIRKVTRGSKKCETTMMCGGKIADTCLFSLICYWLLSLQNRRVDDG